MRPLPYIRLVRTMELQSISRRWQRRILALELYPRSDWGEQPDLSRHRPRSQRGAFAIKLCSPLFGRDGEDRTLTARRPSPGSNRISTPALRISMIGLGSRSGLAPLALRAHYVRLSALRASVEPATIRFQTGGSDLTELHPESWSTRSDSNTRPHTYQTCALPIELLVFGNPGEA